MSLEERELMEGGNTGRHSSLEAQEQNSLPQIHCILFLCFVLVCFVFMDYDLIFMIYGRKVLQ